MLVSTKVRTSHRNEDAYYKAVRWQLVARRELNQELKNPTGHGRLEDCTAHFNDNVEVTKNALQAVEGGLQPLVTGGEVPKTGPVQANGDVVEIPGLGRVWLHPYDPPLVENGDTWQQLRVPPSVGQKFKVVKVCTAAGVEVELSEKTRKDFHKLVVQTIALPGAAAQIDLEEKWLVVSEFLTQHIVTTDKPMATLFKIQQTRAVFMQAYEQIERRSVALYARLPQLKPTPTGTMKGFFAIVRTKDGDIKYIVQIIGRKGVGNHVIQLRNSSGDKRKGEEPDEEPDEEPAEPAAKRGTCMELVPVGYYKVVHDLLMTALNGSSGRPTYKSSTSHVYHAAMTRTYIAEKAPYKDALKGRTHATVLVHTPLAAEGPHAGINGSFATTHVVNFVGTFMDKVVWPEATETFRDLLLAKLDEDDKVDAAAATDTLVPASVKQDLEEMINKRNGVTSNTEITTVVHNMAALQQLPEWTEAKVAKGDWWSQLSTRMWSILFGAFPTTLTRAVFNESFDFDKIKAEMQALLDHWLRSEGHVFPKEAVDLDAINAHITQIRRKARMPDAAGELEYLDLDISSKTFGERICLALATLSRMKVTVLTEEEMAEEMVQDEQACAVAAGAVANPTETFDFTLEKAKEVIGKLTPAQMTAIYTAPSEPARYVEVINAMENTDEGAVHGALLAHRPVYRELLMNKCKPVAEAAAAETRRTNEANLAAVANSVRRRSRRPNAGKAAERLVEG